MNSHNPSTNGVKRFFNKIKDKLKSLISLEEDDRDSTIKLFPASNDMSLIYDAPSMYSSNRQANINMERPSEVEQRRFSIHTNSSPSSKKKTNSVIKIVTYIMDAKFNKNFNQSHPTKSAFRPMDKSQNISLHKKSIINCNDFNSALQRDIVKPTPVKGLSLTMKRERDADTIMNESYSKLNSEKKRKFDTDMSMRSNRDDVSMRSSLLSKRKHDMRSLSMKSVPENKMEVTSMGTNIKSLEEVKNEIEDKKRANSKMFDEISRKSTQLNEINQKRLEYLDRRRIVADYYKDKLRNKKEVEIFNIEPLPIEKTIDRTLKDRNLFLSKQENVNIVQQPTKPNQWEMNKLTVEKNTFTVSPRADNQKTFSLPFKQEEKSLFATTSKESEKSFFNLPSKGVEDKNIFASVSKEEKQQSLSASFVPNVTPKLSEGIVNLVAPKEIEKLEGNKPSTLTETNDKKTDGEISIFKKQDETLKQPSFGFFNKPSDQPLFGATTKLGLFSNKTEDQLTKKDNQTQVQQKSPKQENKDLNITEEKPKENAKPTFTWGNDANRPSNTLLFGTLTKPENQPTPDKTSSATLETTKSLFEKPSEAKQLEVNTTSKLFEAFTKTDQTTPNIIEPVKDEKKQIIGIFGSKDNTGTEKSIFGAPSGGLFAKKEVEQTKEETKTDTTPTVGKIQPSTLNIFTTATDKPTMPSAESKPTSTPTLVLSQPTKNDSNPLFKPPTQESSSSLVNPSNPFINPSLNPQVTQTLFTSPNKLETTTQNNPGQLNPFSINNSNRGTNDIFGGSKPLFDNSSNTKPSILGINNAATTTTTANTNLFMPKDTIQNESDMSICSPVFAPKKDPVADLSSSQAPKLGSNTISTPSIFNSSTNNNMFAKSSTNVFGQVQPGSLFAPPSVATSSNQPTTTPPLGIFGANLNTSAPTTTGNNQSIFPSATMNAPTGSIFGTSNFTSQTPFPASGTQGLFSIGKKK